MVAGCRSISIEPVGADVGDVEGASGNRRRNATKPITRWMVTSDALLRPARYGLAGPLAEREHSDGAARGLASGAANRSQWGSMKVRYPRLLTTQERQQRPRAKDDPDARRLRHRRTRRARQRQRAGRG